MRKAISILTGLAGGLVVGGGIAAFFTALGLVTRIIQISKTNGFNTFYKFSIILGALVSTLIYIFYIKVESSHYLLIVIGLFMGIFVGMIASALAEVLNVIPVSANLIGIQKLIYIIIFAMIIGKMVGSILYWIIPGFY